MNYFIKKTMKELIHQKFDTYEQGYEAAGVNELTLVIDDPIPSTAPDLQLPPPICSYKKVRYRLTAVRNSSGNVWWQFLEV